MAATAGRHSPHGFADGSALPTFDAGSIYGGPASLWGTTWSADVNDANFGVQFIMDEAGVNSVTLQVDFVSITVWYR